MDGYERLWQGIAIGALGVAAFQWLSIGEQLVHAMVLTLKTGWSEPVLTAGTGMLRTFLVLSSVAAGGGAFAARRPRHISPAFEQCARAATYGLVGGAALWLGLIASPVVDLAQR